MYRLLFRPFGQASMIVCSKFFFFAKCQKIIYKMIASYMFGCLCDITSAADNNKSNWMLVKHFLICIPCSWYWCCCCCKNETKESTHRKMDHQRISQDLVNHDHLTTIIIFYSFFRRLKHDFFLFFFIIMMRSRMNSKKKNLHF